MLSLKHVASGTRAELNKSELNKISIRQPATKAEQTAIATILSEMDAEISALEAKLAKTRQIKQGMMQELLTGRIRLCRLTGGGRRNRFSPVNLVL
jgi:type I restriction enzyme, S subunit